MPIPDLETAYNHCQRLARRHYENFPVASFALPKALRRPVAVIYAFARAADDFADEGDLTADERLQRLDDYRSKLTACARGAPATDPVFVALGDVLLRHALPVQLFHDLLTAFTMDVTTTRYATFDDVLHYCRHSANPVGRLLLHLYGHDSEINLRQSDAVCTALQLINFWQDLGQDYDENNRIYVPLEDIERFGVNEEQFAKKITGRALRNLMDFQIQRARELMESGAPLGRRLPGRLGFELRLTIETALSILAALQRNSHDAFARPRLTKRDWLRGIWRAV